MVELNKSAFSLVKIRGGISRHSWALGIFVTAILFFSAFAGFLHNHSDDPFHTQSHETCPATVWAHTPFVVLLTVSLFITARTISATVVNFAASFVAEDYFFPKASRAPPSVL